MSFRVLRGTADDAGEAVVIDVHTHVMRGEHWGDEFRRNWQPAYRHEWPEPDVAAFDAAMAAAGVELAVVFGITAKAAGVHTPSELVADFCAAVATPTVGLMALDPTDADVLDQLDAGVALGLRGIKLYPVMGVFDPRDERFDRFYRRATERELVLLWHMGATPSAEGDLSVSHPLVLDAVARRHPGLRQIVAHMGHPWQRDCVQLVRKNPNVYADISGMWTRTMDAYLALVNAQEWGVGHKLLFGSDFPLWTPVAAVEGLRRLTELGAPGFPRIEPATIEQILDNDPRPLFGLDPGTRPTP